MKSQGELSEIEFLRLMYSRSCVVSKPFGDNARYDFIVDSNGRLIRVQVKSVSGTQSTRSDGGNKRYRVLLTHGLKETRKAYTKNDIDIFAIHVIPENLWYFIPIEDVKSIRISLQCGELAKFTKSISYPYEIWKSNFSVFE